MSLSIRGRLTLWYSAVVVATLAAGAAAGLLAQSRLSVQGVDEDLTRTMATLVGVMHTEFTEGLTLEASADEASREVVAPGHGLALFRADGRLLYVWGVPMPVPAIATVIPGAPVTLGEGAAQLRVMSRDVAELGHAYRGVVAAPLEGVRALQTATLRAVVVGAGIALAVAAAGGWLIGRQTLDPLAQMAAQASRIDATRAAGRLSTPRPDDELGQLATAFNGLVDRLATALHQQRQFMADASHELRTPVSVVRTASQVTLSQPRRSDDEYRESLTIIEEQASGLAKLVDAMFLLSRAEAHGVPLQREFLNLDDVVAETARAARVVAERRGVQVVTTGDQEVAFHGDDRLLRQMVGNLLDNAIRHGDPGTAVDVHLSRQSGRVVLRVTDVGQIIPREDQARIFERFVHLGPSGGAGLGLPISRWIAEAHGGTLTLAHSGPAGTTFVVELPASPVIERSSGA